jgi:hypothetical protein
MVVMAACLVIVVIGFRRGVWVAATVPLAATVVLTKRRMWTYRRLALAGVVLVGVLFVTPGLATDVIARLVGAPAQDLPVASATTGPDGTGTGSGTGGGAAADLKPVPDNDDYAAAVSGDVAANSTEGHVGDLKVGWGYVEKNVWTGVGPRSYQLPGLAAVNSPRIYVHDEWLMDWLRFGPLAPALVTAFLAVLALMGVRRMRGGDDSTIERAAALFGLIAPGCLVLFPYFTTTTRWPLLLGIAAGVLGLRRSASPDMTGMLPLATFESPRETAELRSSAAGRHRLRR